VNWYFFFFFVSGFCGVLYELVWLRLSMAQFGVTTAMVSIVLSVFMAGMGLGAWASGKWLRAQWGTTDTGRKARFYTITAAGRLQLEEEERRWMLLTKAVEKALRFA